MLCTQLTQIVSYTRNQALSSVPNVTHSHPLLCTWPTPDSQTLHVTYPHHLHVHLIGCRVVTGSQLQRTGSTVHQVDWNHRHLHGNSKVTVDRKFGIVDTCMVTHLLLSTRTASVTSSSNPPGTGDAVVMAAADGSSCFHVLNMTYRVNSNKLSKSFLSFPKLKFQLMYPISSQLHTCWTSSHTHIKCTHTRQSCTRAYRSVHGGL